MKSVYAAVIGGAAVALAQNASLPECGSTCINNMIAKVQASPYGCPNNPTCFCCKPDFGYGIRDCANQYCGDSNAATSAIVYAASYCASALPSDQTSVCTSFGGAAVTGGSAAASATGSSGSGAGVGNAYLVPVASGLSGYSVASTTITAGGSEATLSGTAYSALSTNGGVVATASGVTTTYSLNGLLAVQSATSGGANGGAGGAFIVPVASGASGYSIASTTITAGGSEATLSGTEYSALSSDGGVIATASGVTTTYALSALNALASAGSSASGNSSAAASGSASGSGATTITTTTSGSAGAGAGTATTTATTTTTGAAAFITAAPVLAGAAALAMLAL